ncbi:prepilin-type N-terminal cleavage/methylation domain-containing protein [Companilactobacillus suantsaicola]|uniref:Prepilin-type N-terminal cleavage/methylation domain-containing protein n=1 Tax=Companilactobacillus suantsaicola TaxID=2487723 RepID=A0A4Z0JH47_9LACO|nr:competence type IV pilus major pilin ComGC [Companilactobacillus suantsaicola]TGD21290.1 prepilin-type N-terminal cleavage/methylation domain-containing protein [Companilactobacillus suantsaicola]
MKKRRGFTLIEMVIVLFIISLLLLLMIPNLAAQRKNANQKSEEALVTTVTNQAEMYSETHSDKFDLEQLKTDKYITDKQKEKLEKLNYVLKKDGDGRWILEKQASQSLKPPLD